MEVSRDVFTIKAGDLGNLLNSIFSAMLRCQQWRFQAVMASHRQVMIQYLKVGYSTMFQTDTDIVNTVDPLNNKFHVQCVVPGHSKVTNSRDRLSKEAIIRDMYVESELPDGIVC